MPALVWTLNVAAMAALLAALAARRAWRTWPWFALFLLVSLSRDLILLRSSVNSLRYFWVYLLSEPLTIVALMGSVVEVWRKRTTTLVSVGKAGLYLLTIALGIATVVTATATLAAPGGPDRWLQLIIPIRHWFLAVLAVFCVQGLIVLELLGSRAVRAVRRQQWLIVAYLLLEAVGMAANHLAGQESIATVNTFTLAAAALLYAVWALLVRGVAEEIPPPRPGPRAEEVERRVADLLASLRRAAGRPPLGG